MTMKKHLLFFFLGVGSLAFSQGVFVPPQTAFKVVNGYTTPIANASITVCAANASGIPCSPALVNAIFKDAALTQPLSNPFPSDASGNYQFAVAGGTYTVTVTASGFAGNSYQVGTTGGSFTVPNPLTLPPNGAVGAFSVGCVGADQPVGSGIAWVAPLGCTPYNFYPPPNPGSGFVVGSNSGGRVTTLFQSSIDLAGNVGTSILPVPNGGTGNSTASGALINLFPTIIRNGDLVCASGGVWNTCPNTGGNTGTPAFLLSNSAGVLNWLQVPCPVIDGCTGLVTQSLNTIYKGNNTSAMLPSSITDSGTAVAITQTGNPGFLYGQTNPGTGTAISNLSLGDTAASPNGSTGALLFSTLGNATPVVAILPAGPSCPFGFCLRLPASLSGTFAVLIASGTASMPTGALTTNTCATVVTVTATGTLATDSIKWSYNAAPGSPDGLLTITPYVVADNVKFLQCNPTSATQTPVAATINWEVVR